VQTLKQLRNPEWLLGILELIFGLGSALVVGTFKVWDLAVWNANAETTLRALGATLVCAFLAFYAKWAAGRVQERYAAKILQLENELRDVQSELRKTQEKFDKWRRMTAQIGTLIGRKIERIREVVKREPTIQDLLTPSERETQVHRILQMIHSFFFFELQGQKPEGRMRLALYVPADGHSRLELAYSWNGETVGCVTEHGDCLALNSPQGIRSEVVRTFHQNGDKVLRIIPNCETDDFSYFSDEQRSYLKSMLSFKYRLQLEGIESAIVLSLDCDEEGFFAKERRREISEFLVEMLRRFEYEMLGVELVAKLQEAQPRLKFETKVDENEQ